MENEARFGKVKHVPLLYMVNDMHVSMKSFSLLMLVIMLEYAQTTFINNIAKLVGDHLNE